MAGNFQWSADITSGVSRNHALSKELRFASIAETLVVQFARPESGFGANMGDTVTIQRVRNVAEPTSAVLSQSGKMPIDAMAMSTRSITVSEFGRGVGFTRLVKILNHFDIDNAIQKSLKKQMKLTLDTVSGTAIKNGQIRFGPTSAIGGTFTTDAGATSVTGTTNMTVARQDHPRLHAEDLARRPLSGERLHGLGVDQGLPWRQRRSGIPCLAAVFETW